MNNLNNSNYSFYEERDSLPLLSIVIPCYNEQSNLSTLIEKCSEVVAKSNLIEFIFIDNGSTDNTPIILSRLLFEKHRLRSIRIELNQGYGHGILMGLKFARGCYLGWMHADLQIEPDDVLKAIKFISEHKGSSGLFLKGTRFGRNFSDFIFTLGMTIFELIILKQWLWDINGQPTIFSRNFLSLLDNPPNDFSLDLYVFHIAALKNLNIVRYPVKFSNRKFGLGHNDTLFAKIKFSLRVISFSIFLRKNLNNNL